MDGFSAGGSPRQVTRCASDIQSAFSWHPDGRQLAFVCDNRITLCDVVSGALHRIGERSEAPPVADAVVFSPDGKRVAFLRDCAGYRQIFTVQVDQRPRERPSATSRR